MKKTLAHNERTESGKCEAKTKSGGICGKPCGWGTDHPGTGRCKFHGGANPVGLAANRFKDGSTSKYIPPLRMRERYAKLRGGPLNEMDDELALLELRISQVVESLGERDSSEIWKQLASVWRELKEANRLQDEEGQRRAFLQIETLIQNGSSASLKWNELTKLFDAKRKIVSDNRRFFQQNEMLFTLAQIQVMEYAKTQLLRDVLVRKLDKQKAIDVLREIERQSDSYILESMGE